MIFLICGFCLAITFVTPALWSTVVKKYDLLNPYVVAGFFHTLFNVPFVLFLAIDPTRYFPEKFISPIIGRNLEELIPVYTVFQILFYFSLIAGIRYGLFSKVKVSLNIIPQLLSTEKRSLLLATIISIIVGAAAMLYFFQINGGILYVLLNIHLRTEFSSGNGYLISVLGLSQLSVFYYLYAHRTSGLSIVAWVIFITIVLILFVSYSLLGGRKLSIFCIFYSVFAYHFFVKHLRIKLIPLTLGGVFLAIFMIIVPILRQRGAVDELIKSPKSTFEEALNSGADILIGQLSYVPQYTFILNYFNFNNAWFGSSFMGLVTAPIPSSILRDKSPVDDGVYFSHIINRQYVKPPQPYRKLYYSSYPGETLGTMYANFLLPGILIGGYLLGSIYSFSFQVLIYNKSSFLSVILYIYTIMNFHISNLRIANFLTVICLTLVFTVLVAILLHLPKTLQRHAIRRAHLIGGI